MTGGGKLAMRTYSYMTNGTVNELRKYYKQEVPGIKVLDDEKDYCLAQISGEGDAVTIEIIDNGDFRRVDLSKPKH